MNDLVLALSNLFHLIEFCYMLLYVNINLHLSVRPSKSQEGAAAAQTNNIKLKLQSQTEMALLYFHTPLTESSTAGVGTQQ